MHAVRLSSPPEEKRFNDFRYLITLSDQDARNGRYAEARDRYQEVIEAIDSMPDDSLPAGGKPFWRSP